MSRMLDYPRAVANWLGFATARVGTLGRPENPPPSPPGPGNGEHGEPNIPQGAPPPTGHYTDIPVVGLGAWNVERIQNALVGHQNGNFSQSALLAESMVGDDRIQSSLNGRIKGVTARSLHTKRARKDKSGKVRRAVERMWRKVFTDEVLDQLLMWQVFLGFCLCEIQWRSERDEEMGDVWIPYLKIWHPMYVWYDISQRRYVAITQEGNVYIEEDDPHWFLLTPWGKYRGWLRGAVRSCAPPWLIRNFSRRDWARYCEVHGLPIKLIDAPAQSNALDKSRMFAQVRNMGAQSTLLLPQQGMGPDASGMKWDVRLLEAKDESWAAFPGLIKDCDMAIQLSIRGTNLVSEVQGGSYAAAQVHSDEDTAYGDADSRKLCASASRLMRLFCAYNFSDADLAPGLKLEAPDKQDKTMLAQSQLNAVTIVDKCIERGIPIDIAAYFERYDIPLLGIEEGESFELDADESDDDNSDDDMTDALGEIYAWQLGNELLERAAA